MLSASPLAAQKGKSQPAKAQPAKKAAPAKKPVPAKQAGAAPMTDSMRRMCMTKYLGGQGRTAALGDYIELNYQLYYQNPKYGRMTLRNTFEEDYPELQIVSPAPHTGHIQQFYPYMSRGDSAIITIPADSLFGKDLPAGVPSGANVTFEMKVVNLYDKETGKRRREQILAQMREDVKRLQSEAEVIKAYLKKNNIDAEDDGTGVYVHVVSRGAGETIHPTDEVQITFSLSTLDGRKVAENTQANPYSFNVGANKRTILGLQQAVLNRRVGDKLIAYIPGSLAYGYKGREGLGPYENIIMEVTILSAQQKN